MISAAQSDPLWADALRRLDAGESAASILGESARAVLAGGTQLDAARSPINHLHMQIGDEVISMHVPLPLAPSFQRPLPPVLVIPGASWADTGLGPHFIGAEEVYGQAFPDDERDTAVMAAEGAWESALASTEWERGELVDDAVVRTLLAVPSARSRALMASLSAADADHPQRGRSFACAALQRLVPLACEHMAGELGAALPVRVVDLIQALLLVSGALELAPDDFEAFLELLGLPGCAFGDDRSRPSASPQSATDPDGQREAGLAEAIGHVVVATYLERHYDFAG